ncbi:B3 domain-containing protein Os04g0386900-like [Henckelia pumila]|uniref:B3 domain-containing protein Os04g0386900-like n=1 Tax=Henckelia pumila TaxID=405737 RepID=UPI003C6E3174
MKGGKTRSSGADPVQSPIYPPLYSTPTNGGDATEWMEGKERLHKSVKVEDAFEDEKDEIESSVRRKVYTNTMTVASGSIASRLRGKQRKASFGSTSQSPLVEVEVEAEEDVEEEVVSHLLGVPFFDVIFTKSHMEKSCALCLPAHMVQLLPLAIVPVILRYRGKDWNASYRGGSGRPTFAFDSEWKRFLSDNDLKCGDGCVFELVQNSRSNLRFKVHIFRGDLPPELVPVVDSRGMTFDSPIVLD